jgi:hypothetical protein
MHHRIHACTRTRIHAYTRVYLCSRVRVQVQVQAHAACIYVLPNALAGVRAGDAPQAHASACVVGQACARAHVLRLYVDGYANGYAYGVCGCACVRAWSARVCVCGCACAWNGRIHARVHMQAYSHVDVDVLHAHDRVHRLVRGRVPVRVDVRVHIRVHIRVHVRVHVRVDV